MFNMQHARRQKMVKGLTMASSLAWMSILPATAVFAQSTPTVTPGSVSLSGPIHPTNGSATFTASASDPGGTPEYQFWVESPTGAWSDMQNYSTSNTFTLATPSAGDYLVVVDVMDQAQVAAGQWNMAQTTAPDGVFNGSTVSVVSNASGEVAKGQSVTLTATSSGIFDPLYQFWYQAPDGTWSQSGAYSSSTTFTFTAGQSGAYKYVAYAKSPAAANNQHGALQSNVGSEVAYGTASQVVLTPASPTLVANGSATDLLTATVEDSHGDVVANFSGTVWVFETNPQGNGGLFGASSSQFRCFSILPCGSSPATSGLITLMDGVGSIAISAQSVDENYAYELATDNLVSTTYGAGGVATQSQVANVTYGSATVMTTAPSDNRLGLQSTLPNLESNAESSTTVWVELQDSTGAPYRTVNGQYVNLTLGGTASGSFSATSSQATATIEVAPGTSQFPVTVYSQKGVNGTITVTAQSEDPTVMPLNAAFISIPVMEVGVPAAVTVRQVGTVSGETLYAADVVDASGNTISLGSGAAATFTVTDNTPISNPSAVLGYDPVFATPTGIVLLGTKPSPAPSNLNAVSTSSGQLEFAVFTEQSGDGKPVTIKVADTAVTPALAATTTWTFSAPTPGYTEFLPRFTATFNDAHGLQSGTVTAGETAVMSAQLTDQYGNPVQTGEQPIWFTLETSNVAALPNGAIQAGDTYEAFTNSQGIASIPLHVLSNATAGAMFQVATSGTAQKIELGASYWVVSPTNYATALSLSGEDTRVTAGTALPQLTATLENALGGIASGDIYDEILFQSSNSGVVSFGSGATASGAEIMQPNGFGTVYAVSGKTGGSTAGLFAGMAGTATITVTDVSNAAMPSASFTITVVPGGQTDTPWIEYNGQHVSNVNEIPLPANTPVELQVVNVDQAGDPIDATGTTPLAVQLPVLPSGQYWQASNGGVSSSSMVVDIKPGETSANVWIVSSTAAKVSSPSLGLDAAEEAVATAGVMASFTGATTSTNGSMVIDLNYDTYGAALMSSTVAAPSAFAVTDSTVTGGALTPSLAVVSGNGTVALTVTIGSGSVDAQLVPSNDFTVTTSASAVDSTLSGETFITAPVSASTSGAISPSMMVTPSNWLSPYAAYETGAGNSSGSGTIEIYPASTTFTTANYASSWSNFAAYSGGVYWVEKPELNQVFATLTGTAPVGSEVAVWPNPPNSNSSYNWYIDIGTLVTGSGALPGYAYAGFTFAGPTGSTVSLLYSYDGQWISDTNTSSADSLYIEIAEKSSSGWSTSITPETFTLWVVVNGAYYRFVTHQP